MIRAHGRISLNNFTLFSVKYRHRHLSENLPMAPHIKIKAPRGQGQQRRRRYAVSGEVEAAAARAAVAVEASQIADALLDRETAATAPTTSPAVPLPAGVQLPFPTGPAVEDVVEEKEEKEGKNKPGKAPPGFPTVWKIVVLVAAFFWLFPRLVTGAEVLQTASGIEPFCASTARFVVFKHVQKMAARFVPRPGPANLGPNSGLDEWLEEAKQCHYLPESVMKELCEKVKEVLMEGIDFFMSNTIPASFFGIKFQEILTGNRIQYSASVHSSDRVRRHPRPVLRPSRALPSLWWHAWRDASTGAPIYRRRHHVGRH